MRHGVEDVRPFARFREFLAGRSRLEIGKEALIALAARPKPVTLADAREMEQICER